MVNLIYITIYIFFFTLFSLKIFNNRRKNCTKSHIAHSKFFLIWYKSHLARIGLLVCSYDKEVFHYDLVFFFVFSNMPASHHLYFENMLNVLSVFRINTPHDLKNSHKNRLSAVTSRPGSLFLYLLSSNVLNRLCSFLFSFEVC